MRPSYIFDCFAITAYLAVLVLLFGPIASAQSKSRPKRSLHEFASPDHAISFQYSYPLTICTQDAPACSGDDFGMCVNDEDVTTIACVAYVGRTYKGTNFRNAVISLGSLPSANDEAACLNLPGEHQKEERINGLVFQSSTDGEGAAGTFWRSIYYRTFASGRCYSARLILANLAFSNFPPGVVRRFTSSDAENVFRSLKQVLNTLHISKVGESGK